METTKAIANMEKTDFDKLVIQLIPSLTIEEKEDLINYYHYFQLYKKKITEESMEELKDHPVFGKMIREMPEETREAQNKISDELQKNAIFNGLWQPYVENMAQQGIVYARMGLNFYSWYEIIVLYRKLLIPKVISKLEQDGKKVFSAINGMNRLFDIAMCVIGEAYLFEKKSIVEKQKREQELLNKELEQFIYIASHDLQEPLNTVTSFISLLEEYKEKLQGEPMEYVGYIKESTARMSTLITDLLEYSRVGRKSKLEETDLNIVLKNAVADLKGSISENNAFVETGEMPTLVVHPVEMKLLFQNLLSNAIKFRKKDVPPHIVIYSQKEQNNWHFIVEDNGIGIDEKHKDRIFVIFQRLHNQREYPGTGIGLSHCKKIVEHHHGKIWIESELGKGTKFHFSIPENEQ